MECRQNCGACCIAVSISSAIPGMLNGKPAGIPCIQLDDNMRCKIFGQPERPKICINLRPCEEMCGENSYQALSYLVRLELETLP